MIIMTTRMVNGGDDEDRNNNGDADEVNNMERPAVRCPQGRRTPARTGRQGPFVPGGTLGLCGRLNACGDPGLLQPPNVPAGAFGSLRAPGVPAGTRAPPRDMRLPKCLPELSGRFPEFLFGVQKPSGNMFETCFCVGFPVFPVFSGSFRCFPVVSGVCSGVPRCCPVFSGISC